MTLRIYEGHAGSKFVCDSNRGFGDAVAAISRRAEARVNSVARERAAEPLLDQIGKMSQRELYACWAHMRDHDVCLASCHGNCNPANPPGKSTHERRNDGVAYPHIAVGVRMPYWRRGVDIDRARVNEFCAEARKEGWVVTATYPGSPSEAQHVNFRKKPKISLWEFRPVKRGDSGRRAGEVIRRLRDGSVLDPDTRKPYLDPQHNTGGKIDLHVHRAIKRFQRDHHQHDDGVVGVHTITALREASRAPARLLSNRGLKFIASFEGFRGYAYADPVGHATVGYGHLLHHGPPTTADIAKYGTAANPKLSRREGLELLRQDVERFEQALRGLDPRVKAQHRFDAIVSITFNVGTGILAPDRSLGGALRAKTGRTGKVAEAILLYDKAGSPPRPLAGLTRRRRAERRMWLRGDYSTD